MTHSQRIRQLQTIVHRFHGIFGHHDLMMGDLRQRVGGVHSVDCVVILALARNVPIVAGLLDAIDRLQAFVGVVEDLRGKYKL